MSESRKTGRETAPAPAATTAGSAIGSPASDVSATLTLTAPAPVAIVATDQAAAAVKMDAATMAKLDDMAAGYVDALSNLDPHDPTFAAKVGEVAKLGDEDIKASAGVSSRLLDRPVAAMHKGGLAETSIVSRSLIDLRRQVEDLDPSHQGDLFSPRKLLGFLPFGGKLRGYFGKYQSSQGHLNAIIEALDNGQSELVRDNTDIETEKANLWAIMGRLREYVYLGQKLDLALTAKIAQIEAADPEQARVFKEDLLFPVRQKVQDLITQLAVSVQGYLALDVIRRNNLELIRGVDRATTTTVSALRTAVIVAQALSDQKLVLDQITALNATTSSLIESTSILLRQQSVAINEQAGASTVEVARLQAAFDNIYATIDEIDTFKLAALDSMAKTVDALSTQLGKSQAYLERSRAQGTSGEAATG